MAYRWIKDPQNQALITSAVHNPVLNARIRIPSYAARFLPKDMPSYTGTQSLYEMARYLIAYHGPGTARFIPGLAIDTALRLYAPSLFGYILWSHHTPHTRSGAAISPEMQEIFNVFFMRVVSSPYLYHELISSFNHRMLSSDRPSAVLAYPPPHHAALRRPILALNECIDEEWIMRALYHCGLTVEDLVPASVFTTRQMDFGIRDTAQQPLHQMFCTMDSDRLRLLDKYGPLPMPRRWDGWIVLNPRDKEAVIGIIEGEELSPTEGAEPYDRFARNVEDWILLGQDPLFTHCRQHTYLQSKETHQLKPVLPSVIIGDNNNRPIDVTVLGLDAMSLTD